MHDIYGFYKKSNLVVFPSKFPESNSNVILESIMSNTPLIVKIKSDPDGVAKGYAKYYSSIKELALLLGSHSSIGTPMNFQIKGASVDDYLLMYDALS